MAEGKSLKEQNAGLIRAAMIGHIVAFAWIAARPLRLLSLSGRDFAAKLETMAAPGTAALGLIIVASLILLGIMSPNWRDRVIHWRWDDPLPGCRAFSVIGPHSSHVDMPNIEARHGPLPERCEEQNKLFYKIYREHRDDIGVLDAHGRYLAARDIGTITVILVVTLPWLAWWANGDFWRSVAYGGALLAVYGCCVIAAKNYSWRMVQHVLALASSSEPARSS